MNQFTNHIFEIEATLNALKIFTNGELSKSKARQAVEIGFAALFFFIVHIIGLAPVQHAYLLKRHFKNFMS